MDQPFRLDEETPEKQNAQDNQHRDDYDLYESHSNSSWNQGRQRGERNAHILRAAFCSVNELTGSVWMSTSPAPIRRDAHLITNARATGSVYLNLNDRRPLMSLGGPT